MALQPDVGASPSELTFGKNVRIPGQLLMDPGAPPTEMELQQILSNVRNNTNKTAIQPSSHNKPEPKLSGLPLEVTHVYTRQHKAVGLQTPYEGPFAIVDRPSRSTVKLDVGQYKSGERRFEIRHLNDIKAAHPKSMAAPAQRPVLGRPKTSGQSGGPGVTEAKSPPSTKTGSGPVDVNSKQPRQPAAVVGTPASVSHETSNVTSRVLPPDSGSQPAKIQTTPQLPTSSANDEFEGVLTGPPPVQPFGRPIRSTRNPYPLYVDSFWLASAIQTPTTRST